MGRVLIDHTIMGGVPCIRRHPHTGRDNPWPLGEGVTTDEVLDMYPQLVIDDITACLRYAADAVNYRTLPLTEA